MPKTPSFHHHYDSAGRTSSGNVGICTRMYRVRWFFVRLMLASFPATAALEAQPLEIRRQRSKIGRQGAAVLGDVDVGFCYLRASVDWNMGFHTNRSPSWLSSQLRNLSTVGRWVMISLKSHDLGLLLALCRKVEATTWVHKVRLCG